MSTSSPQDTFPFPSLLPELRQRINGFCSPQHERFGICSLFSYIQFVRGGDRSLEPSVDIAGKDSLPQLLRTCRQINEAKRLLYRNNIFEASRILLQRPWPKMEFFGPESQKEVRHMSFRLSRMALDLTCEWDDADSYCTTDDSWANMLGSLSTLELIVPNYYRKGDAGNLCFSDGIWTKNLKKELETIKRLVSQETKIMVDVDVNKPLIKAFEEVIPNRCIFGRLEPGDKPFLQGEWTTTPENRARLRTQDGELLYRVLI